MDRQPSLLDPEVLEAKLRDANVPGFIAELDPAEAEQAGAFEEDALSEQEALESASELLELLEKVQP